MFSVNHSIFTAVADDTGLLSSEFLIVFPTGHLGTTACTTIPITNDTLLEGSEEFSITITDAGTHALISSSSVTTVTISDRESE